MPVAAPQASDIIDPDFLAALPPELRAEIEQNHDLMRRNLGEEVRQPVAQPMDNATFIASIQDPAI
jgi:hypothetical protein